MDLFLHYLSLPYLLKGIGFTLAVTGLGLAGGLVVGVVLASMQLSRFPLLAACARGYSIIFRGTPLILQMVFAYNVLPLVGIKLTAIAAGGLALALNEAPFIAEMLRSGVLGVDRGQVTAGQALGMTPGVLMRRVIAPQAIRTMVPALGSESVSALKNSSLASVIAVEELTLRSTQLASSTFDFFSVFCASGLIYLVLTGGISLIQLFVEDVLDLDKPAPKSRFARLLPWRRVKEAATSVQAGPEEPSGTPSPDTVGHAGAAPAKAAMSAGERSESLTSHEVAVRVTGLCKGYGEQPVLDGLSLIVRTGEVVALLGPSGSGKSTLLRCISHLDGWDMGQIHVGGKRLGYLPSGQLMTQHDLANERATVGVGMVFQQFNLFSHLTALENIAGPLRWVHGMSREDADRRARELLERVGLSHRVDALPRHMSGGQQQRVAIARALAPNPSVLLLDEPTSALDPELVNEVLDVIRRLAVEDGLTMIISTHQLRFAEEVADRVVFLSGGSVVEAGPAHEVLKRPRHPLTAKFLRVMGANTELPPPSTHELTA
ncbi:MAG: ABC transporter permease [Burkholderiales bacterium RIFOXYC12_FULL_60_6]|nr:MAG: ABC transporter permease [Burkholderiales bacterium RIFOXYC12_FULL_60_6]